MHYTTVIFDVSGTLIDSKKKMQLYRKHPVEYLVLRKYFPKLSKKSFFQALDDTQKQKKEFTKKKNINSFANTLMKNLSLPSSNKIATEMRVEFEKFDYETLMQHAVRKNALQLLHTLYENDYKLGVITNTDSEWFRTFIKKHQLENKFRSTIISWEKKLAKPDPKIFKLALQELKSTPEETLLVGNSKDDAACQRLGIDACIINQPKKIHTWDERPKFIIKDLMQVRNILEEEK